MEVGLISRNESNPNAHNQQPATYELMERNLRATRVEHEPPRVAGDGRDTDIRPDNHVPEEQPLANDRLAAVPGRDTHDAVVWWVEAESSRRQTVRNQVHPEQLYRNERFGHAEQHRQEDADDLADVRRDCATSSAPRVQMGGDDIRTEVADELFRVVVDQTTFLNSLLDGREVRISEHHVCRKLRNIGTASHRHTDVSLLERGSIVDSVTGLSECSASESNGCTGSHSPSQRRDLDSEEGQPADSCARALYD